MPILDVFGEAALPINAVKERRYIGQESFFEDATVLRRVFVEISLVELGVGVTRNDAVLCVDTDNVNTLPVNGIVFGLPELLEILRFYMFYWKVFKHFQDSLGSPSPSSNCEYHRRKLLRDLLLYNLLAYLVQMGVAIGNVEVFVGTVTVKEGSADAHLHDVLPESFEEVDGAGHTRVLPEGDQPVSIFVSDLFVINEANIAFQDCV